MGKEQQHVYGIHTVEMLLKENAHRIKFLWLQDDKKSGRMDGIIQKAKEQGVSVRFISRSELDNLSTQNNHQGVVAKIETHGRLHERQLYELLESNSEPPFLLILDCVTDPHNLGACLRSSEAAGVQAVVVPDDNSAPVNAIAMKVASGAAEVLPVFRVVNLVRTIKQLKELGIWVVGADGDASASIYETDLTGPLALILGSEEKGMRRLTREHCDFLAKIPMMGTVPSLNVSVSAGICLFETLRQRKNK